MKLQIVPMALSPAIFALIAITGLMVGAMCACAQGPRKDASPSIPNSGDGEDPWLHARTAMVDQQIRSRGVEDPVVLEAMNSVPRHLFVPVELAHGAYEDRPLPIGAGQTISQPYIVALMTELLKPKAGDRILEVGTGSGYQAAVLAEIVADVYTIEIVPSLAEQAQERLSKMGYSNIHIRAGDGYRGWPEAAPFDGVIVTAAPDHVPQPLVDQLKAGGRLVIPVGEGTQDLLVITRTESGVTRENVIGVRFVPMTGEAEQGPGH